MKRRRLIVVRGVLIVVVLGAMLFWPHHLSSEERALVGTWGAPTDNGTLVIELAADGRLRTWMWAAGKGTKSATERWAVRDGRLIMGGDISRVRRAGEALAHWIGLNVMPSAVEAEVTNQGDYLLVKYRGGGEFTWTRILAD